MMLVDTSVWIDFLNGKDPALGEHLDRHNVLGHPFVVGELACGNLQNRQALLSSLQQLPQLVVASPSEVLFFIEQNKLMGKGIGYIDAHLLASVFLAGSATLWTRDQRLLQLAVGLGVAANPEQELLVLHDAPVFSQELRRVSATRRKPR
jgi:predicted nucleic acid-binding protein